MIGNKKAFYAGFLAALLAPLSVWASPDGGQSSAVASRAPDRGAELAPEYQELLRLVQKNREPVQEVNGTLNIFGHPGIGRKDARVILVEFGDFQCPYCRRHMQETAHKIKEQLVSTGQVRYVFLDFPMEAKHPMAPKAAAAARCAEEQGMYWEMRKVLFERQKALQQTFLVAHAETAGLDPTVFRTCMESGRHDAAIREDRAVGMGLGVKGTPTFFVGISTGEEVRLVRRIQGVQPYEMFAEQVKRAIEMAYTQNGDSNGAIWASRL